VVVNDFDLLWPGFRPDKAEPELVVDADAVLAMAVSPEWLQAIAWRDLQIVEAFGGIEDGELAKSHASEASKAAPRLPFKEGLGVAATKRPDHAVTLPPLDVGTPGSGAVQGDHQDFSALLSEVHGIGKPPQHEPAGLPVNQGEGSGIAANALHRSSEGFSEVPSQSRLKPAVPALGF